MIALVTTIGHEFDTIEVACISLLDPRIRFQTCCKFNKYKRLYSAFCSMVLLTTLYGETRT